MTYFTLNDYITITTYDSYSFEEKLIIMLRVLVVDDLIVDRFLMKRNLSSNYQVTTLSSASEANAFALANTFDIALLNVMLHNDLDCIDLLKDLENIPERSFIPIAITCHIDHSRHKKIVEAGFKAVLKKPFDLQAFNRLVHEFTQVESTRMNLMSA